VRVLVTGANGFLGRAVVERLAWSVLAAPCSSASCSAAGEENYLVRAAARQRIPSMDGRVEQVTVGALCGQTEWGHALAGVDAVIHTAAKVHVLADSGSRALSEYRVVNTEGTLNLARQAAAAGAKRFIFLSSVKVNGECSPPGRPFTEQDAPNPQDAYSISKYEAEVGLSRIAAQSGMAVTVIRPPLVYGPGVKANFRRMMDWVARGLPLPLGALHNRRSLLALDNLVDFIVTCLGHPAAANQVFFVADGHDLSTAELLVNVGQALGTPARLLPVPPSILKGGAALLGKTDMWRRLCMSLQVDISKAREVLGWLPPISVNEGMRRAAAGFLHEKND